MTKLWTQVGKVLLDAMGRVFTCADCPCGDKCCGNVASALCAYLSSSDGCHDCMNGQVVKLFKGVSSINTDPSAWAGQEVLSCGTLILKLRCGVCSVAGCVGPAIYRVTISDCPNAAFNGTFDIPLDVSNSTNCNWGANIPGPPHIELFASAGVWGLVAQIPHGDIWGVAPIPFDSWNCLGSNDLSVVTPGFESTVVVVEAVTDELCKYYTLEVDCGGQSFWANPSSCTCSPFSLSFDPITLSDCCDGTVSIVVLDTCP
jgi:hypothetical protein